MNFNQFNKVNKFDIDTKDFKFIKLAELEKDTSYNGIYPIKGMFTMTSKFGKQGIFITDKALVNIPNHMTETIEQILTEPELIDKINKGIVFFEIYKYDSKTYKKECYGIKFKEIEFEEIEQNKEVPF